MRVNIRALLIIVLIGSAKNMFACDVCGGGSSIQGLGLLPQFSKHFVGVQYLYYSTETSHPSLFEGKPNELASQNYMQMQVWSRVQIAKKFQLFAFVPYVQSVNENLVEKYKRNGFGDASLMVNYALPIKEKSKAKQLLLLGMGLKIPTGKFDIANNGSLSGLTSAQTGTGSFDFLASANYTHKWANWGYNADANYLYTTANKDQYKFGNKFTFSALAFYWVEKNQLKIVPQMGLRFEHSLHDYTNFKKKYLNEETGAFVSFAAFGAQFFYKNIGAKLSLQLPIYQQSKENIVHYNARTEAGIFFLF